MAFQPSTNEKQKFGQRTRKLSRTVSVKCKSRILAACCYWMNEGNIGLPCARQCLLWCLPHFLCFSEERKLFVVPASCYLTQQIELLLFCLYHQMALSCFITALLQRPPMAKLTRTKSYNWKRRNEVQNISFKFNQLTNWFYSLWARLLVSLIPPSPHTVKSFGRTNEKTD